jgi:hypothetical protein
MQSAKKRFKALSALSMAAASTLVAKSANAVSLSLYYGNTGGPSGDGIYVGSGAPTNTSGTVYLSGHPQQITPNLNAPTTITVPIGSYLSISINALLTGDSNPEAGKSEKTTARGTIAEPANLGLGTLGIEIPVSANDANGSLLQPLTDGAPFATFDGNNGLVPAYNSYAVVNTTRSVPGGPLAPLWTSGVTLGDVEQNSGSVGAGEPISGNSFVPVSTPQEINVLQQFSASTAAYSNSTEFFEGLVYQATGAGTVTLSPYVNTFTTQYWSVLSPASNPNANGVYKNATAYTFAKFGASDTVGTLPDLVIDVPAPPHAVVTLTRFPPNPAYYGTSAGTLTETGIPYGTYTVTQISGLNDVINYVQGSNWYGPDEEIYALDVLVNGVQANSAQLATLLNEIYGDGLVPQSGYDTVTSSTTPLFGFPTGYNLFLTYSPGPGLDSTGSDYLGIDLSSTNDANLVGYSFSAVAAIPEPMSLSLLAMGSLAFLTHRNRRLSSSTALSCGRERGDEFGNVDGAVDGDEGARIAQAGEF